MAVQRNSILGEAVLGEFLLGAEGVIPVGFIPKITVIEKEPLVIDMEIRE